MDTFQFFVTAVSKIFDLPREMDKWSRYKKKWELGNLTDFCLMGDKAKINKMINSFVSKQRSDDIARDFIFCWRENSLGLLSTCFSK